MERDGESGTVLKLLNLILSSDWFYITLLISGALTPSTNITQNLYMLCRCKRKCLT